MIYEILIQGGLGDACTYLARLASVLNPSDCVRFKVTSGYDGIPALIQELVSQDPRVIDSSVDAPADVVLDFRPDLAPLAFPLRFPFRVACSVEAHAFAEEMLTGDSMSCVIQPVTTSGNNRGFEEARYWHMQRWQKVIYYLQKDFEVIQIGSKSDFYNFSGAINLCGKTTIDEAVALVLEADLFIGTASWAGLVSAYALKPTIYFYLTDHQTIGHHFDMDSESLENLLLITDRETKVTEVTKWIEERFKI